MLLFFAQDIQIKLTQPENLRRVLELNAQLDSRFSFIYHAQHQFGLQAFLSHVPVLAQTSKSNIKNTEDRQYITHQSNKNFKASFSAQAKHLFLEMENHSQQHSEQQAGLVQKPFLEDMAPAPQTNPYETPCFNILEEMLFQTDFIAAHLLND
jgi:hypothetical protein